ncbi:hypothetical protein H6P81_010024 [Aristolochia fimbriata]|uniref:Transcription factor CBF/NF-Y/archaeal histone domain-containing protein n=1 Tax=Aristolochia fimbriata TaxID=158543 RepID=A0AAV7ENG3_ARIFI|nr:hypothetical protein H6P81_010024 [Aristolochia fimbriata]
MYGKDIARLMKGETPARRWAGETDASVAAVEDFLEPLIFLSMEPMDIVGKSKEDVSLPKATMFKIIKEMLPPDVRVARDAQDLLVECCVEFINLISSESNEVCSREEKRTIAPEHVLKALEVLGFGEYIEEVYAAYEQHKLETLDSPKGGKWNGGVEMTEEEALAEQQRMFAEARARMNNGVSLPKQSDSERSVDG